MGSHHTRRGPWDRGQLPRGGGARAGTPGLEDRTPAGRHRTRPADGSMVQVLRPGRPHRKKNPDDHPVHAPTVLSGVGPHATTTEPRQCSRGGYHPAGRRTGTVQLRELTRHPARLKLEHDGSNIYMPTFRVSRTGVCECFTSTDTFVLNCPFAFQCVQSLLSSGHTDVVVLLYMFQRYYFRVCVMHLNILFA